MAASSPAELPALPPSVAEWEDLLVRMEIVLRVVRNTLEATPPDDPAAAEVLYEMVQRELRTGAWLESVSDGGPRSDPPSSPAGGWREDGLRAAADRFVGLRARNFAMLQRRGLEVWRWTGPMADYGEVSAFQVVTWLVAADVRALAALRERAGGGTPAC